MHFEGVCVDWIMFSAWQGKIEEDGYSELHIKVAHGCHSIVETESRRLDKNRKFNQKRGETLIRIHEVFQTNSKR